MSAFPSLVLERYTRRLPANEQPNNPLHGITLQALLQDLVDRHGFEALGQRIPVRCFTHDPSMRSSLKFLRKTPWARAKVEALYLRDQRELQKKRERNQARAARRARARVSNEGEGDAS